ncbi:MAG TPA: hypothetical protein VKX24_03825, partial [Acidimicrobiia bacterium]|nr:hypothetical protein [Acidimicrobiia bacterium]
PPPTSDGTFTETRADPTSVGRETGVAMEDPVLDEAFMRRYRELLDAEDNAFDELEHAYEDGDREHFETDFAAWQTVLNRKLAFLERRGLAAEPTLSYRSA